MAEQTKRQQLEIYLAERASQDPDFRARLLEDPKATIEAEIGMHFPASLDVRVYEERLNQLHVVLPIDLSLGEQALEEVTTPGHGARGAPFWKGH